MAGVSTVHAKIAAEPDKLSSPSNSSSSRGGGSRHSSSNHARTPQHTPTAAAAAAVAPDAPYLVIRKQPTHVFWQESFTVEFALETPPPQENSTHTNSPPTNVDLKVTLEHTKGSSGSTKPTTATLVIVEEPRLSPSRHVGKVVCQIVPVAAAASTAATSPTAGSGGSYCLRLESKLGVVRGVVTDSITAVHSKLRVEPASDWSNVWFKDEGGREKSMEVVVTLQDRNDQAIVDQNVELKVVLCYGQARPLPVMNQGILRLLGSERCLALNKVSGQTKLRYRVEDVSKNHQGQNFVLEISSADRADIAPAYTPAVTIRSKRNKRHRAGSGTPAGYASPPMSQSHLSYPEQQQQQQQHRMGSLEGQDLARLRDSVQIVVRWTDEVVNGIYPLQWQVMGYAHNPDGSLDYNRPYHNMHNPNAFFARILTMYNESTREHLHVLRRAVEQAGPQYPHRDAGMYDPMRRESYSPAGAGSMMPGFGSMPPPSQLATAAAGMPPFMGMPPPPMPGMMAGVGGHGPNSSPPKPGDFPSSSTPGYYPGMPPAGTPSPPHQGVGYTLRPEQLREASNTPPKQKKHAGSSRVDDIDEDEDEYNDESNVEYVLAKQFKAFQTGEKLGFPAYSASKDIVGFFRESHTRVGVRHFVPIRQHVAYFGPAEFRQATQILEEAIASKSKAVHSMKEWGSLVSLLDHALVYDWSKDIGTDIGGGGGSDGGNVPASSGDRDL